ncbi:MAG: hypothetical protein R2882_02410 [Gemmatimonadales bacterium]
MATRIIDSPRERLVAIITNNFSLCNGRWPTQTFYRSLDLHRGAGAAKFSPDCSAGGRWWAWPSSACWRCSSRPGS